MYAFLSSRNQWVEILTASQHESWLCCAVEGLTSGGYSFSLGSRCFGLRRKAYAASNNTQTRFPSHLLKQNSFIDIFSLYREIPYCGSLFPWSRLLLPSSSLKLFCEKSSEVPSKMPFSGWISSRHGWDARSQFESSYGTSKVKSSSIAVSKPSKLKMSIFEISTKIQHLQLQ